MPGLLIDLTQTLRESLCSCLCKRARNTDECSCQLVTTNSRIPTSNPRFATVGFCVFLHGKDRDDQKHPNLVELGVFRLGLSSNGNVGHPGHKPRNGLLRTLCGYQKVLRRPVRGFPCTGCAETLFLYGN